VSETTQARGTVELFAVLTLQTAIGQATVSRTVTGQAGQLTHVKVYEYMRGQAPEEFRHGAVVAYFVTPNVIGGGAR
jgi:hypothetical protein